MCPPGYHHNGFMATPELGHRILNLGLEYIYITPELGFGIYIYIRGLALEILAKVRCALNVQDA